MKLWRIADFFTIIKDPEFRILEIQSAYEDMRVDQGNLRHFLVEIAKQIRSTPAKAPEGQLPLKRLLYRFYMMHGLLLSFLAVFNSMLQAFDPDDMVLQKESVEFNNAILALAETVAQGKPLGSCCMPISLVVAWATAPDLRKQLHVEEMLAMYQTDFAFEEWMEHAIRLKGALDNHLLKLRPLEAGLYQTDFETGGICCVA